MGPDGFLGRRPEAVDLCREVGLGDALVPIAARGASVWARGRLRDAARGARARDPDPVLAHGPLRHPRACAARSAWPATPLLPRPDVRGPIGDRAIGPLVARKLGRRVVDTLVDPLIGGIHAGSVDDMSAAATFPPLLAAAQRRGGLMRALRAEVPAPDPDGPPLFWSLDGGMASLVDALAAGLRGARRGRPALDAGRPPRAGAGGLGGDVRRRTITEADARGAGRRRRRRPRDLLRAPRRRGGRPAWMASTTPRSCW